MRVHPPFGHGGGTGKSDSIKFHNASGSSSAAINRDVAAAMESVGVAVCYKL